MLVSIIIPTHNRRALLSACLSAATAQTYADYEVMVVDDGSQDGSGDLVRSEFPQTHYIRQATNAGPARARNTGIRAARGEIVLFADDDCLLPPDCLARLVDGYRRYSEVAGVGGYPEAPPELLARHVFARYERHLNRDVYGAREEERYGGLECPAGSTSCMSYRRSVLLEVHGFNETFPVAAGEDAELKRRVVDRGYKLLYLPIRVTHLRPYDLSDFWQQQVCRGRGAFHYEAVCAGHRVSAIRMAFRAAKRTLRFLPDIGRLGPRLAAARLLAGWADVVGQYRARRDRAPARMGGDL